MLQMNSFHGEYGFLKFSFQEMADIFITSHVPGLLSYTEIQIVDAVNSSLVFAT